MAERILTRHPDAGREGVSISKEKYETIRTAILRALSTEEAISFPDLIRTVQDQVGNSFDGSVSWYVTTVKLDLESRGEIDRDDVKRVQYLKLSSGESEEE